METKDLRIGNYMQDNKGRLCEVLRLSKDPDEVRISSVNCAITSLPVRPIPLNEEWLLRLGFRKSSGVNPLFTFGNTMLIFRTDYEAEELENYYEFRFGIASDFKARRQVRLDYVHQLQNLTSILEGEELLFKP